MERLGETNVLGVILRDVLERHGWETSVSPAFGEPGVLAIASRNGYEIRRVAGSESEAVLSVFEEAGRFAALGEVQLPLPIAGVG